MLSRLFPRQFDNGYRGSRIAPWLFGAVALVKALQGFNSLIMPVKTMVTADGIPLTTFNPVAQRESIVMFALLGMYLMVVPLIGLIALIRYRAMVPLLFLVLIAEQLGARAVNQIYDPSPGGHAIGFYINLGILAVTLLGFVLSLLPRAADRG